MASVRIDEKTKRSVECPACGAGKGKPCRGSRIPGPNTFGGGWGGPPDLDRAHDARRSAALAAKGGPVMRRILLVGPPGSGKTRRARALAASLAPLTGDTFIESAWIRYGSRVGAVAGWPHFDAEKPPFRAPHHTVSEAGLAGAVSDRRVRPSEVNLAHGGCLFLDELPEFSRGAIEHLAHALRVGETDTRIWKTKEIVKVPARPALLVCAANLCPCGFQGTTRVCACSSSEAYNYHKRLGDYVAKLGITEIENLPPVTVGSLMKGGA